MTLFIALTGYGQLHDGALSNAAGLIIILQTSKSVNLLAAETYKQYLNTF